MAFSPLLPNKVRTIYQLTLLFTILSCTCVRAQATDGFELDSDDDGVTVWVRSESNDDMSVRVSVKARAGVEDVRSILDDASAYPQWVHRCATARTLPPTADGGYLFISRIDMPFPFHDKVVVARVLQKIDARGRLVRNIEAEPNGIPLEKGEDRLQVYTGKWVVTPDAARQSVTITCTVRTDAGSGLPNWVRKEIMTGGPVKTMINLRERLEEKAR